MIVKFSYETRWFIVTHDSVEEQILRFFAP
jgi:hypothetical protein